MPDGVVRVDAESPLQEAQSLEPGNGPAPRLSLLCAAIKELPGDFTISGRGGVIHTGRVGSGEPSNFLLKALGLQQCFIRVHPRNVTYEMESMKDSTGQFGFREEFAQKGEFLIKAVSHI